MIYLICILIGVIAELVVIFEISKDIFTMDKKVVKLNQDLAITKPSIEEISKLSRGISEQLVVLAQQFKEDVYKGFEKGIVNMLSNTASSIMLYRLHKRLTRKLKKNIAGKIIKKALKVFLNML